MEPNAFLKSMYGRKISFFINLAYSKVAMIAWIRVAIFLIGLKHSLESSIQKSEHFLPFIKRFIYFSF